MRRNFLIRNILRRAETPGAAGISKPPNNDDGDAIRFVIDAPAATDGRCTVPLNPPFTLAGWALAREGVVGIRVTIDGVPVGEATYGLRREDVNAAFPGYTGALQSGFIMHLPGRGLAEGEHQLRIEVEDGKGNKAAQTIVFAADLAEPEDAPGQLRRKMPHAEVALAKAIIEASGRTIRHRFLMRLDDLSEVEAARSTIEDFRTQALANWSLTVVAPATAATTDVAAALGLGPQAIDGRVEVVAPDTLDGLAQGRDVALAGKTYFGLVAPGDELSCDAILELALTASNGQGDFYYADERRRNPASGRIEPFFKPRFSSDLLLSTNYIGRLWCADEDLLRAVGATFAELQEWGEYDLLLRLTEQATAIRHVPKVLCQSAPRLEPAEKERSALERALTRRGIAGQVAAGRLPGTHRIKRQYRADALVSIIIPTAGAGGMIKTCIESIRRLSTHRAYEIICLDHMSADQAALKRWLGEAADLVIPVDGPFNWALFNNMAAEKARGGFLLFLNDDIEIEQADWIEGLVEQAERPEVGVVGPLLLYPNRLIQHAGMFLAKPGIARHAFRCAAEDFPGYFGLAQTQREVSAVTGACMMVRRDQFFALGGFDQAHAIVNNDLDYCLRVAETGGKVVYTPHVKLVHHEMVSRHALADVYDRTGFLERWRQVFLAGDPYFHPQLSTEDDGFLPDDEPSRVVVAGPPLADKASMSRILVVKLDHLGDFLTALPAIRRLKADFPAAAISLLTPPHGVAIAEGEPAIDHIIPFNFALARTPEDGLPAEEAALEQLAERLKAEHFDLAVDLRKCGDTRHILRHTGARLLAGFDCGNAFPWLDVALEWETDRPLTGKRSHVSTDLLNLASAVANACGDDRQVVATIDPATARRSVAMALGDQGAGLFDRPVVSIHPSAGNALRQWPPGHFADLIRVLLAAHPVNVVLIGAADEAALAADIVGRLGETQRVWNLAGRLPLGQLPSLLAASALFIGNNSGPKHLAAGLGVPTVGIHSGVIASEEWGPVGRFAVALRRQMSCAPCYYTRAEECPRQVECLTRLTPEFVYGTCRRLFGAHLPVN